MGIEIAQTNAQEQPGALLHEQGDVEGAKAEYRQAIAAAVVLP